MVRRNVFDVGFEHYEGTPRGGGLPDEVSVGWVAPGRGDLSGIWEDFRRGLRTAGAAIGIDTPEVLSETITGGLTSIADQAASLIGIATEERVAELTARTRARLEALRRPPPGGTPTAPTPDVRVAGTTPQFEGPRRFSVSDAVVLAPSTWPAYVPVAARVDTPFVYVMGESDTTEDDTKISRSIARLKALRFLTDARAIDTMTASVVAALRSFQAAAELIPTGQLDTFTYYRINHEAWLLSRGKDALVGIRMAGTPSAPQAPTHSDYRQPADPGATTSERLSPNRDAIRSIPGIMAYLRGLVQPSIPKKAKGVSPVVMVLLAVFLYFAFKTIRGKK